MTQAHYEAEIFIKNRLDALLKPIVGINQGRNAPLIKANDTVNRYLQKLLNVFTSVPMRARLVSTTSKY